MPVTMRRTVVYFCLGVAIVAALLPCAMVPAPSLSGDPLALADESGRRYGVEADVISSPLLARITPRHLARASLPSFAA